MSHFCSALACAGFCVFSRFPVGGQESGIGLTHIPGTEIDITDRFPDITLVYKSVICVYARNLVASMCRQEHTAAASALYEHAIDNPQVPRSSEPSRFDISSAFLDIILVKWHLIHA